MSTSAPSSSSLSRPYFRSLDGLRLLASLNIVLFHFERAGGFTNLHGHAWFLRIVKGPMFHATMFFILGGFIFYFIYEQKLDRFSTRRFLLTRIKTLYPLHVLTTLAMVPFAIMKVQQWSPGAVGRIAGETGIHLGLLFSLAPVGEFTYNTPSWALSAFFFCYLLFGPALRLILRIDKPAFAFALAVACMVPPLVWTWVYGLTGWERRWYLFFHIAAPIRFFEFLMGMAVARLFRLAGTAQRPWHRLLCTPWGGSGAVVVAMTLLYLSLGLRRGEAPAMAWISYHVLVMPLFALLVYACACECGPIAAVFRIKVIRQLGKSSFYPYLLHIPVVSWVSHILARYFDNRTFLHEPLNVAVLTASLYVVGAIYGERFSPHRGLRHIGKVSAGALREQGGGGGSG